MANKRWIKILICIFIILILYFILIFSLIKTVNYIKNNLDFQNNVIKKGLVLEEFNIKEYRQNEVYANLKFVDLWFDKKRYCAITEQDSQNNIEWKEITNNYCDIIIGPKSKYLIIKDEEDNYEEILIDKYINKIINLEVNISDVLLLVGEKQSINISLTKIGNPNENIKYIIENENVVKVENNEIIALADGITNIKIIDEYGNFKNIKVIVTSLITKPKINDNKAFLREKVYTVEQAKLLNEVLAYKINKAGNSTRAGVVEAARFLTLEFMYKVPYFLENGRLQKKSGYDYIDGEGRYYHKGLYLSEDNYSSIKSSTSGPAMWGKYINEYSNERIMPNGLDCSGFVSWAIYNGGFDCGDIGAGPNYGYHVLTDYGISQIITMNLLKSGKVKAGDLIGYDGHIGIIIGVEDGFVYVADSILYTRGVCATKYSYSDLIYESGFTHIYDMSSYYKEDGNYTNMWE